MNDLQVFMFDQWRVRIIDRDGLPWWILRDVCEALGIANAGNVADRLSDDEKADIRLADTSSNGTVQARSMTIVNESGLYATILRSDKPEAKRFRHWITAEVLPSIRRTGGYHVPQGPELMALAVLEAQKTIEAMSARAAIDAPKVESFEALMRSDKCLSITDAAKHFGLHPKTEVFPYLRALKYLTQNDLPSQAAIDQGYLALKEVKDREGNIWPQAVVEVWQLENWRAHVVPQIKRWNGEEQSA